MAFPPWYKRKQGEDATVSSPDTFRKTYYNIHYSVIGTIIYIDYTMHSTATKDT